MDPSKTEAPKKLRVEMAFVEEQEIDLNGHGAELMSLANLDRKESQLVHSNKIRADVRSSSILWDGGKFHQNPFCFAESRATAFDHIQFRSLGVDLDEIGIGQSL